MSGPKKPVVRLEHPSSAKSAKKKPAPPAQPVVKLAIRLNEGVNEALRQLIRYRGDLSIMAIDALQSVDLATVPLVSAEEKMVRDTTISLAPPLHEKLKLLAAGRAASMNILVNTALAYWLAKKGSVTLR